MKIEKVSIRRKVVERNENSVVDFYEERVAFVDESVKYIMIISDKLSEKWKDGQLQLHSVLTLFIFFHCRNILLIGSLGATSISLAIFLYLSHFEMSESSEPGNDGPGQVIASVRYIRLAIFLITTSLISACAIFNVLDLSQVEDIAIEIESTTQIFVNETDLIGNLTLLNYNISTETPMSTTMTTESTPPQLEISPIYLFLCGLSLSAISAFLRAGFILKLIVMICTVFAQTAILYMSRLFKDYDYFKYQDYNSSM